MPELCPDLYNRKQHVSEKNCQACQQAYKQIKPANKQKPKKSGEMCVSSENSMKKKMHGREREIIIFFAVNAV